MDGEFFDQPKLTLSDLRHKRAEALLMSEKAALAHPETYRELKRLVREINAGPLDVSAYYRTASALSAMLRTLSTPAEETVFDYFCHNTDPRSGGDVRYFRGMVLDLAGQIECLDRWRRRCRHLKVVQSNPAAPD
jgi:hypothetical protein